MNHLESKLDNLPTSPGVYYHLDKNAKIIYVGKAANLRHRVRHYFQKGAALKADPKTLKLRSQISDVQWSVTGNALQALLLESEMIKRYQPKYNILERNVLSSRWLYVQINLKAPNPNLLLVRELDKNNENLTVLGPYLDIRALKRALKYLRRSFPYSTHQVVPKQTCLDYHLGLCPGPEVEKFDLKGAQANLRRLLACLKGEQTQLLKKLKEAMKEHVARYEYEQAAKIRNQIYALTDFKQSIIFTDLDKDINLSQDKALTDLGKLFNLSQELKRIEAYDISHISGRYTTASMVVAQRGILRPALSRRFKSQLKGNDDFKQIRQILRRRFNSQSLKELPDLILIDGGRGQVSSTLKILKEFNLNIPTIGLAKKEEQIVFKKNTLNLNLSYLKELPGRADESLNFITLKINLNTPLIKFLQRLRDASHRNALTYHNYLQTKSQMRSDLLDLPTIGEKTYQKLINAFGSTEGMKRAPLSELKEILSPKQLEVLRKYFKIK